MKLKLLSFYVLLSLGIFLSGCSSCSETISYPFHYDESDIKSISIIYTLGGYDPYNTLSECEILLEIDDIDNFLTKFKEVHFGRYFIGDPTRIDENEYAILVLYNNDDFELIGYFAQSIIIDDVYYFGKVYCDKEEFNTFINSYLINNL